MKKCILLLFLSGCLSTQMQPIVAQQLSPRKQKQKIIVLEKKLQAAKKAQRQAEAVVEAIVVELEDAQLALVRRQLDEYEKKHPKEAPLFVEEREMLHRMIEEGPNAASFAAQAQLDRILRLRRGQEE